MADPGARLVAVVDDARLERQDFLHRLAVLLDAGLPAVWLRARGLAAGPFLHLALRAREATGSRGAELWIGDRADIARLVAADRLHLPEGGLPARAARGLVTPGTLVGRSVHGVEAALAATEEGVDHLVVGTIFATPCHAASPPAGAGLLQTVLGAIGPDGPTIYAIGGMEPDRVASVRDAGADGVVALRALWDATHPERAVASFLAALDAPAGGASTLEGR